MKRTLVCVVALALAGCGGSAAPTYNGSATLAQAQAAGVQPDAGNVDAIAAQAPTSFYAHFGGAAAVVPVWPTTGSASSAAQTYAAYGPARLDRWGNAVVAWDDSPTAAAVQQAKGIFR